MRADEVTIIVSTTNRPAMLRTALESIANQSAISRIARVLVSENAGGEASGAVAAEFKNRMPVDYIQRTPRLPALEHARALTAALPADGSMAILHDDDWWGPEHLALSLARLAAHPQASATYSSFFEVTGESSLLKSDSNLMFWFGAGFPAMTSLWVLDEVALWLSCLPGTPARYSTLVAPVKSYRQAAEIAYRQANNFDNDRRIVLELARLGAILFAPTPEVFIRMHSLQDSGSFKTADQINHLSQTTRHVINVATAGGVDLSKEIGRRLSDCPADAKTALLGSLSQLFCVGPLDERGVAPPELCDHVERQNARPNLRYYLGQCLPPVLLEVLKRGRRTT